MCYRCLHTADLNALPRENSVVGMEKDFVLNRHMRQGIPERARVCGMTLLSRSILPLCHKCFVRNVRVIYV